jgi:hypothetical protein
MSGLSCTPQATIQKASGEPGFIGAIDLPNTNKAMAVRQAVRITTVQQSDRQIPR